MATDKKSVLLYCDIIHTVDALEDVEAGKLFKHFLRYINDLNPCAEDRLTSLLFEPIKQSLKRDLVKWEKRAERSRENGKYGGRPPLNTKTKEPEETHQVISKPRKPDIVSVKDSVIVKDIVNDNINISVFEFDEFWNMYPNKVGKSKCIEKWKNISNKEKLKIKDTLSAFTKFKPFATYSHPNPLTYLNQKRWEDVIPNQENNNSKEPTKEDLNLKKIREEWDNYFNEQINK